jgi:ABC-type sugar transport system permease subunit
MNTGFRPFAGFKLAISAYAAIWGTGFLSYLVMPYLIGSVAAGILLWHFCDNSIWGFSERIGNKLGMEPNVIGWLLGGGLFVAVIGGLIASSIGTRYGRIWPVCVGVATAMTCISVITSTVS